MKISFDLQDSSVPLKRGHLKMGGLSRSGDSIELNNRYLLYNDVPWIPVMGEFHYSRYDSQEWEAELIKMKAAGIQIVSSYLIWLHHEEREGVFNFSGDRNVRDFVKLCKKHGLFFLARLGPWVHGEVRNGGFPDWVCQYPVRTNAPVYLALVKRLYAAYYEQLSGLLFKDDGPVMGVQIENELVDRPEHLLRLKEMAVEAGFEVPLYTVTAWAVSGVGQFPKYETLPVFGSYPEAPWRSNIDPFERKPHYLFAPGRNDITIGSDLIKGFTASETEEALDDYPFAYCEIGPGVQATYHRRPLIRPYDLYTITMITLAKGNNLPGYYVFHGGRNPKGPLGLYQESKKTGYPNDLPVISYDFQAPIGEYGFIKPSFHYYRLLHHFLQQYGKELAPYEAHYPDVGPKSRKDNFSPRLAVRTDAGGSGYLFFNTNQRNEYLGAAKGIQAVLGGAEEELVVPQEPMDIPAGTSGFFPIKKLIEGSQVIYGLAQPVTEAARGHERYCFYMAIDGIPVEFLLGGEVDHLRTTGKVTETERGILVSQVAAGREPAISYESKGVTVHLVVLKSMDALRLYRGEKEGQAFVMLSDAMVSLEEDHLLLYGESGDESFELLVFPLLALKGAVMEKESGIFTKYRVPLIPCRAALDLKEDGIRIRQENLYTPYLFTEDLEKTKEYLLNLSVEQWGDADDLQVYLDGEFDVIQIYEGEQLTGDAFHLGGLFELGVKRYEKTWSAGLPVRLKISPYAQEKKVFLEQKIERDQCELSLYQWKPWYKKCLEIM